MLKTKVGKSAQRLFGFYRLHFQFHEPYTILLDGNSLFKFLQAGQDYRRHFTKLIKDSLRIKTTQCVLRQIMSFSEQLRHLKAEVNSLQLIRCNHFEGVTPKQCILDLVGQQNPASYMICTQDLELIQKLLQIPRVPVFYVGPDQLIRMRQPLAKTKQLAARIQRDRINPLTNEQDIFQEHREEEFKETSKKWLDGIIQQRNRLCIRIKKKARGPNPLSIKQKQKFSNAPHGGQGEVNKKKVRSKKKVD